MIILLRPVYSRQTERCARPVIFQGLSSAMALSVTPLHAPALRGPVRKTLQLVPILPAQKQEFLGTHVRGFLAQKRFKPPLEVGAVLRLQAIASRRDPIQLHGLPHRPCLSSYPPSGADRCSCTKTQLFPRFSQIPV